MTAEHDRDPNVLTIDEAARILGKGHDVLASDIKASEPYTRAFVIPWGRGRYRISKPRLLRFLHGRAS